MFRVIRFRAYAYLGVWMAAGALAHGQQALPGDVMFEELPIVEAATLHAQTLEEAPANVTIITAADIRRYGYRTLGEALSSVRGFYGVDDRSYQYFGARGLNLPGDYNTRFLVMLNGHPLTENIYSSNGFYGQDFGIDMDLVERIEVIRGPTAALYGSNGMLANINIVTKSPVSHPQGRVSTETDTFGARKLLVSSSTDLGKGRNLLVAGSVFNNRGRSFVIPGYDGPETNFGRVSRLADRERGYHGFANFVAGRWNVISMFSRRQKNNPVPWGDDGVFGETDAWLLDERNLAGATYSRELANGGKLRWQTYFDQYSYRDQSSYWVEGESSRYRNLARGEWVNSQFTYLFPASRLGLVTAGAFASVDLRNHQATLQDGRQSFAVGAPDRQQALFVQTERRLGRRWTAYLGGRADRSANYGLFFSPRAALVYRHSPQSTWKFVYGRPFRNPSAFEKYGWDGTYLIPSENLRQERAHSFEVALERKLGKNLTGIVNAYNYKLSDIIQLEPFEAAQRYSNLTASYSRGVEFELQGSLTERLSANGSWALQTARNEQTGWLVNSPRHVVKARAGYDLLRRKLTLSGAFYGLSGRRTPFGNEVGPVRLGDVTLSTHNFTSWFDLVGGVRNVADSRYLHPVALAADRIPADGRCIFVKLIVRTGE